MSGPKPGPGTASIWVSPVLSPDAVAGEKTGRGDPGDWGPRTPGKDLAHPRSLPGGIEYRPPTGRIRRLRVGTLGDRIDCCVSRLWSGKRFFASCARDTGRGSSSRALDEAYIEACRTLSPVRLLLFDLGVIADTVAVPAKGQGL